MKRIIIALLEEGILEEDIHRILDIIETSDEYKANKIQDAMNSLGSLDNAISYLDKTGAPKPLIKDLEAERARRQHKILPKIDRIEKKQIKKREEEK